MNNTEYHDLLDGWWAGRFSNAEFFAKAKILDISAIGTLAQPAGDARDATNDAFQRAAGELPHLWNIEVDVENGAASVTLFNDEGDGFDYPIDRETSIADAINAAIDAALTQEQPNG